MSSTKEQKLTANAQYVLRLCQAVIKDVRSGKCTDEQINGIIAGTEPRCRGFINPDDYITAETAMRKIGVHRNQFFALVKQHGIKVHKINNQPIGYHRTEIEGLRKVIRHQD